MAASAPDPTHRKRELPQNELEATSQLKLGEFQTVPTLSLSEARLVINKVLDLRKKGDHKFEEREYDTLFFSSVVDNRCRISA